MKKFNRQLKKYRVNLGEQIRKGWKVRNLKINQKLLSDILHNKNKCYKKGSSVGNTHKLAKKLWELYYGESFPKNMDACHTCDNVLCINIFHIFVGTRSDNMIDCVSKDRLFLAKLSNKDVVQIRSLHASGNYTYTDLAIEYNVTKSNICAIIKRKTWRHLK